MFDGTVIAVWTGVALLGFENNFLFSENAVRNFPKFAGNSPFQQIPVRHAFATLIKTGNARFTFFLASVVLIGSYVAWLALWTPFFAEMTDWAPIEIN